MRGFGTAVGGSMVLPSYEKIEVSTFANVVHNAVSNKLLWCSSKLIQAFDKFVFVAFVHSSVAMRTFHDFDVVHYVLSLYVFWRSVLSHRSLWTSLRPHCKLSSSNTLCMLSCCASLLCFSVFSFYIILRYVLLPCIFLYVRSLELHLVQFCRILFSVTMHAVYVFPVHLSRAHVCCKCWHFSLFGTNVMQSIKTLSNIPSLSMVTVACNISTNLYDPIFWTLI